MLPNKEIKDHASKVMAFMEKHVPDPLVPSRLREMTDTLISDLTKVTSEIKVFEPDPYEPHRLRHFVDNLVEDLRKSEPPLESSHKATSERHSGTSSNSGLILLSYPEPLSARKVSPQATILHDPELAHKRNLMKADITHAQDWEAFQADNKAAYTRLLEPDVLELHRLRHSIDTLEEDLRKLELKIEASPLVLDETFSTRSVQSTQVSSNFIRIIA